MHTYAIVIALSVALAQPPKIVPVDVATISDADRKLIDVLEAERLHRLAAANATIKNLRSRSANATDGNYSGETRAALRAAKDEKANLEAVSTLCFPVLPTRPSVGDVGTLRTNLAVRVVQIVDGQNVIVKLVIPGSAQGGPLGLSLVIDPEQIYLWISGYPTAGLTDDKPLTSSSPFQCTGTKRLPRSGRTYPMIAVLEINSADILSKQRALVAAKTGRKHPGGLRHVVAKKPVAPLEDGAAAKSPDEAAQKEFGAMLHNARTLIKAKIYSGAEKNLRRIIKEAPGTKVAAEAQQVLDEMPKNQ